MPTDSGYLPRTGRGGGSDIFHVNSPSEQGRYWVDGDPWPRIVLDVPNGQVLVGPGSTAPTPLGGGGGGAPINASYITRVAEGGLSNESTLGTLFRADVIANRGAFGTAGQMFFATDTLVGYLDTGAAWVAVTPVLDGGGKIAVAAVPNLDFSIITTGTVPSNRIASTLTGKRITKRVETLTDAATVTFDTDNNDGGILTTVSQPTTFANPSGTPTQFQQYTARVKSTVARALSHGGKFRGSTGLPLPTTTSGGGLTDYFGYQYNLDDDRWDLIARSVGY